MRILTLVAYYYPGFKAGGPIRTMVGMVDNLGESFKFWILTSDRDYKDTHPYTDVPLAQWVTVGNAKVFYIDINSLSIRKLRALINEVDPDIVYLNSLFSSLNNKYLLARRLRIIPQIPTLVAPRGVFSPGALQLNQTKKRMYLLAAQKSGLLEGLRWQASSKKEQKNILTALPSVDEEDIFVTSNLTYIAKNAGADNNSFEIAPTRIKESGQARFIFLSRITPVKNLEFALTLFLSLEGDIRFDIFGPVQDRIYWENCQKLIAGLPEKVHVNYYGPVTNKHVKEIFSAAHFLLLPTLGENFGHVILESLQEGCPVIISDQTPWTDLVEVEAGWVIPLKDQALWIDTLQGCLNMDQMEFTKYSSNAINYAARQLSSTTALQANRNMFLTMASQSRY